MKDREITDQEALEWLNENCISFTIGNSKRERVGFWHVETGKLLDSVKKLMARINQAIEEQKNEKYRNKIQNLG